MDTAWTTYLYPGGSGNAFGDHTYPIQDFWNDALDNTCQYDDNSNLPVVSERVVVGPQPAGLGGARNTNVAWGIRRLT